MRAGILTEKIIFKSPKVTRDEYGNETTEYVNTIVTRGGVYYKNGVRLTENQEITNVYTMEFITRIFHSVNEKMIIRWNDRDYRILAINQRKKNQSLLITGELINE